VFRRDFSEFFRINLGQHEIEQAVISNRSIVVSVWNPGESELYLLCLDSEQHTSFKLNDFLHRFGGVVRLPSENIAVLDTVEDKHTLREINLDEKVWGKNFSVVPRNYNSLFPVSGSSSYDLLMSDGTYLYGYCTETRVQMTLLEWVETGISGVIHSGESGDGRLSILTWDAQLYILTPVSREMLDTRTVLTIGGIFIPYDIQLAVSIFNRTSETHQIKIVEYIDEGATFEHWQGGFLNLQLDLMTGSGPDIIYDPFGWMTNHELLFDLYPFIDVDPELSRTDFFTNILTAFENPSGNLPMITNSFNIRTMIGPAATVGHIQSWTPSALLELVEQNNHMLEPLGPSMNRELFIHFTLRHADSNLIDWDNHTANIDSEEFISLLNAAMLLPEPLSLNEILTQWGSADPFLLMLRGEQLLDYELFFSPNSYNLYTCILGDIVVLGIPTSTGGIHIFEQPWQMGINAASVHADAAWEFIRGFILPTVEIEMFRFPLRIDLYDKLIDILKTPEMMVDNDGNLVEIPSEFEVSEEGRLEYVVFNIYAMTDAMADSVRNIIDIAVASNNNVHQQTLFDVIDGDIASFFAGIRSAEDTARIIQNRVQTFLNEQR
jgi:hypothetical protein